MVMVTSYRPSRNIEASIYKYLETEFNTHWSSVNLTKAFSKVNTIELPVVCIKLRDTDYEYVELGDTLIRRLPVIMIDVFASSDGQRLDLKDFIINKMKSGCPYNEYEITSGEISKTTNVGRITIINMNDSEINFNTDKAELDVYDRYRHRINLTVSTGKVE